MAATAHSIRRKPVRLKPSDFHPVTLPGAVAGASRVQNGALTARFGAAVGAQIHWRAELPEVARWPAVELRVAGAVTHGRVPATAVVARILWKNAAGELLAHETQEYIPHRSLYGPPSRREPWPAGQGEFALHDIRAVPQGARRAELILAIAGARNATVAFHAVTLRPAARPPARRVHVGTSCWWPAAVRPGDPARSSAANIAGFVRQIERAAKLGVELLVLPEGMTVVGVPGGSYSSVAEAPDGPATRALAAAAKRHRMHVIACYNLRVAEHITNTATLFGPNGKILGRYDKVHVPNEEVDGGVVEGRSFPVFETALGTIGMMICWDVVFPEAARALALRGAEIIALPIWGGQELLMQARALENHVYLLSSGFDARNTIVDPQGRLLANQAAVKGSERVAKILHANIDLAAPHRWPWVGDFAHRWPFERRGV